MKRLLVCLILTYTIIPVNGQIKLELQAGGANFIGMSLNTSYDFALFANGYHKISPTIGLGALIRGSEDPTSIIHGGLNYQYKRWGIGTEVSGFAVNPFWGNSYTNSFVDMIVYPNFNFTYTSVSNFYFRVSAGAYFAFDKDFYYETNKSYMYFAGDVIPGAGLNIGYQ